MEGGPGILVDFRLERGLERTIGVVCAEEVRMADEEALLVVISVDEPAGDTVRAVAPYLARARMKYVDAVHLHAQAAVLLGKQRNVRLPEDHEQVPLPGVLEVVGHMEVGVHARLEDRDTSELIELS